MPCADYEHRPRICREFTCGRPCTGCGACCINAVLLVSGQFGDEDDSRFYALHRITVEQQPECWSMTVDVPCALYVEGTTCRRRPWTDRS